MFNFDENWQSYKTTKIEHFLKNLGTKPFFLFLKSHNFANLHRNQTFPNRGYFNYTFSYKKEAQKMFQTFPKTLIKLT